MLVVYLDPRLNTSYKVSRRQDRAILQPNDQTRDGNSGRDDSRGRGRRVGDEPALGDRHAGSGHQERQRVAIRSHVDHQDDTAERRRWEGKEDAGVPLRLSVPVRWL